MEDNSLMDQGIAIIGISARLPKAPHLEAIWQMVRNGMESISFFSEAELEERGVHSHIHRHPHYVPANGVLDSVEYFDAAFFGYLPNEASTMDPQHRLFLECAWEALEHAGYTPDQYTGAIGVYAGTAASSYLIHHLLGNPALSQEGAGISAGQFSLALGNDKDYLSTRVSYKLNLKGPSISVNTACSTSLVAVHLACQSLLVGECDMALAGGVAIHLPQQQGYVYQEGGILSPDGHCRAFDARAQGTVGGNGLGIVVLKRLADALADGDTVHAVIRGSAMNNDGAAKVGYTAPSVEGQARVITEALSLAGVTADTITYIETHGTGTILGDPIEIKALTQAFRVDTQERNYCAIGSIKANIGHLDAAAGIAGLIKVVLALKQKELPPQINYEQPNPHINFADSPFYVNTELRSWDTHNMPRRAGVSSFGIGGTNVHVILEEAPPSASSKEAPNVPSAQLLTLSARTPVALERIKAQLAEHLRRFPTVALADVLYTQNRGRKAFSQRWIALCHNREEVLRALEQSVSPKSLSSTCNQETPAVAFLFPGQGSQYPGMLAGLYREEPVFREHVQYCARFLAPHLGYDLCQLLFAETLSSREQKEQDLVQTQVAQVALFVVEYALARLWMEWGVRPEAMLGHSIGEYVAACLAGVFSLDDALRLVVARGQLMQRMPPGVMLAVGLSEEQCQAFLGAQVALAAINGPARCVIAGPEQAIALVERQLVQQSIPHRRLRTSHAFHSSMMEPIVEEFAALVRTIDLKPPALPFLSNVTGTWISPDEATDPGYWARHLRASVRFSAGVQQLLQGNFPLLLEVGPGNTLQKLVQVRVPEASGITVLHSIGLSSKETSDLDDLLLALGRLWLSGVPIDWSRFYAHEQRQRLPLPTYPFDRQQYWIEDPANLSQPTFLPETPENDLSSGLDTDQTTQVSQSFPKETSSMQLERVEHISSSSSRRGAILTQLHAIIYRLSGIEPTDDDLYTTFFEKGFDSLFLLQVNEAIRATFQIEIGFRQLFEELPSLAALADYLDQQLPPEVLRNEHAGAQTADGRYDREIGILSASLQEKKGIPDILDTALHQMVNEKLSAEFSADDTGLVQLMARQLAVLERQLEVFQEHLRLKSVARTSSTPEQGASIPQNVPSSTSSQRSANGEVVPAPQAYGPYKPVDARSLSPFTEQQQRYLERFTGTFTKRTQRSKQQAQRYRQVLADPVASATFKRFWKEMAYPIVVTESQGSKLVDLDGNEYVDLTMGFGVNLFGHRPPFLMDALQEQLAQGIQVGPQSSLAGQVAELVCELTGMERAIFCNSGTEAVMAALRLARAVTRRTRIVIFAGSYHGSFDGVLARQGLGEQHQATPIAPGTVPNFVSDILVLDYGRPESLETIKHHAHELAGVLVEPVQSRRPALQPREFLLELRAITKQAGIALICDEVITGFRMHAGGVQGLFGFQADIATYGKVVGGGMPIGIVAGKAQYMDALDGGWWNYGDDSFPQAAQTFFAGTFCKHPLAMAAAKAVLGRIKSEGPELQEKLEQATNALAQTLNNYFEQHHFPIKVVHFGSLFSFSFQREQQFSDLFFNHLVLKGVFVWEGRTCFLSTAHSEQDREYIIDKVKETVVEMRTGGFLLPHSIDADPLVDQSKRQMEQEGRTPQAQNPSAFVAPTSQNGTSIHRLPLTDSQQQLWVTTQLGKEASCAYNELQVFALQGVLDLSALEQAFQRVIERHEALRVTFSSLGDAQLVHPALPLQFSVFDYSSLDQIERQEKINERIIHEKTTAFDLPHGPLLRVSVAQCAEFQHVLLLTMHHLITDSWSSMILINEVSTIYTAIQQEKALVLPEPASYSEYIKFQVQPQHFEAAERYWQAHFPDGIPFVALPTDYPRPIQKTYQGARCSRVLTPELYQQCKMVSARYGSTLFISTLALFTLLVHYLSAQDDLAIGIHISGQPALPNPNLIGFCISVLPFRNRLRGDQSLAAYLASVRGTTLEAHQYRNYAFSRLAKQAATPQRSSALKVIFNCDSALAMNVQEPDSTPGGLQLVPFSDTTRTVSSKWDLSCNVIETGQSMMVEWTYDTDLFATETIKHWQDLFETLLATFVQTSQETTLEILMKQLAQFHQNWKQQTEKRVANAAASRLKRARRKATDE